MADRSLIAIVTPAFGSRESVEALKREAEEGDGAEVRLVAPAVEINPLHHTLGDIDEPRVEARKRLTEAVAAAKAGGVTIATRWSATPIRCRPPRTRCWKSRPTRS